MRIEGASYFFTVVTFKRIPILAADHAASEFIAAVSTVQAAHPFKLDAHVILPDHLHMLWTLPEHDSDYPTRWRQIKSTFTRRIDKPGRETASESRRAKQEQAVWQRRYWEHTIKSDADFVAHVEYIHFNPVKHQLAAAPKGWWHSSFREWVERGVYDLNWGSDNEQIATRTSPD